MSRIETVWGKKYTPGIKCPSTCKNAGHVCARCASKFIPKWPSGTHAYCSKTCQRAHRKATVSKTCPRCASTFTHYQSDTDRRFCSVRCRDEQQFNFRSAASVRGAAAIYGCACLVCGFDRHIEYAHILPASLGGTVRPGNILPLCPNHHALFDKGALNIAEMQSLSARLAWP